MIGQVHLFDGSYIKRYRLIKMLGKNGELLVAKDNGQGVHFAKLRDVIFEIAHAGRWSGGECENADWQMGRTSRSSYLYLSRSSP